MRRFVRHPAEIPIELEERGRYASNITAANDDKQDSTRSSSVLQNLSIGGLRCEVDRSIAIGTSIQIRIPLVNPDYTGQGVVVWCRPHNQRYEIGIEFDREEEAFKSRMVEQVCLIEQYRKRIRAAEGRELDGEQAAREWISRYAGEFAVSADEDI
jgi:Tfp pilus assembly protein PilZ